MGEFNHPDHRCQAIGCMVAVDGNMLMCTKHWKRVPESIKFTLFSLWEPELPFDQQREKVQDFIFMAVQQVAIFEGKVMS